MKPVGTLHRSRPQTRSNSPTRLNSPSSLYTPDVREPFGNPFPLSGFGGGKYGRPSRYDETFAASLFSR